MKVKRSAPTSLPTGWFPKTEFQRIVDATYAYGEWRGGRDFHFRADRLRALACIIREGHNERLQVEQGGI
jgi:hypothetical protein